MARSKPAAAKAALKSASAAAAFARGVVPVNLKCVLVRDRVHMKVDEGIDLNAGKTDEYNNTYVNHNVKFIFMQVNTNPRPESDGFRQAS